MKGGEIELQEVMAQMLKTTNHTGHGNAYGTLKTKTANNGNGFGDIMRSIHQNNQKTWAKPKEGSEVKPAKNSTIQADDEAEASNPDQNQVRTQAHSQAQNQVQSDSSTAPDANEELKTYETNETQDNTGAGKVDAAALMLALAVVNQQTTENTGQMQPTEPATAPAEAVTGDIAPAAVKAETAGDTSVSASVPASESDPAAASASDSTPVPILQAAAPDTKEPSSEKPVNSQPEAETAAVFVHQTSLPSTSETGGETAAANLKVQVAGSENADADASERKGSDSKRTQKTGAAVKNRTEEKTEAKSAYTDQTAVEAQTEEENGQKTKSTSVKDLITMENDRLRGTQTKEGVETSDSQQTNEAVVRADAGVETLKTKDEGQLKNQVISTKVETKEIIDQIVNKFELVSKGSSSSVTIELKPEFLGKLHINLSIEDGVLTARFHTDNQQVRHMLEGGIGQLKSALENNGIRLEKAEVNVDLNNSGSFQGFNQPDYQNPDRQKEVRTYWVEQISKPETEYEVVSAGYAGNLDGSVNYVI